MTAQIRDQLAPTGVLRTAINLSNFLLVTDKTATGDPVGVSPDIARAVADRLGIDVEYITYATPGELADAAVEDVAAAKLKKRDRDIVIDAVAENNESNIK